MNRGKQEQIFRQWMADHPGIVRRSVRAFAAPADQDDLLQDILLAVWNAIPAFRGEASPATFIYRVAQNTAMTWRRRVAHRTREEVFDETEHGTGAQGETDERQSLYRAIRGLPELDRSLILLQLDGLSYREIAEVVGLESSNVGVRLHRIRARLADQLKEQDHDPS